MDTTVNTVILGRGDQVGGMGRTLTRLAVAGLMAVLLLGVMSSIADARTVTTTLGQNDFVGACRNGGGTPKRVGSRVVQCTTADGTVVTCDFNSTPASCTIPFTRAPSDPMAPITGGVLEVSEPPVQDGPKTGVVVMASTDGVLAVSEPPVEDGPKADGIVVAPTDGVLVQAEATPPAEEGQVTTTVATDRAVIAPVEEEKP